MIPSSLFCCTQTLIFQPRRPIVDQWMFSASWLSAESGLSLGLFGSSCCLRGLMVEFTLIFSSGGPWRSFRRDARCSRSWWPLAREFCALGSTSPTLRFFSAEFTLVVLFCAQLLGILLRKLFLFHWVCTVVFLVFFFRDTLCFYVSFDLLVVALFNWRRPGHDALSLAVCIPLEVALFRAVLPAWFEGMSVLTLYYFAVLHCTLLRFCRCTKLLCVAVRFCHSGHAHLDSDLDSFLLLLLGPAAFWPPGLSFRRLASRLA